MHCRVLLLAALMATGVARRGSAQPPPALEPLLAQIAAYEHGQDRKPVAEFEALLRGVHSTRAPMGPIEQRMIRFLESDATFAGKELICRHLAVFGTDASVPVLAKMSSARETAEIARYTLEQIPGQASLDALRAALAKASGKERIGWINSLGARRDAASTPALAKLLGDSGVGAAAADALAAIGNADALRALEAALPNSSGRALRDALLRCAWRILAADGSAARGVYRRLAAAGEETPVRIAALRGLTVVAPEEETAPLLEKALSEGPPALQVAAIQMLGETGAGGAILAGAFPKLPPAMQARTMAALENRVDAPSKQTVRGGVASGHAEVRLAALRALAASEDAAVVPLLAARAAATGGDEQKAARESLYAVRGAKADEAVIAGLRDPDVQVRLEMIRAAGERAAPGAGPALLEAAGGGPAEVSREALRALRETAGDKEIPRLVELLIASESAASRREAERALMAAVRRSSHSWTKPLEQAFRSSGNAEVQGALLQVLSVAGRDDALPLFREALKAGPAAVRRAAVLALASWPDTKPLPDLIEAARRAGEPALAVLALRSYIKLASLPSGRPPSETARLLEQAYDAAKQAEEKRAVLAALPAAPCAESLALAERAARDADVAKEAAVAVGALRRALK